MQTQQQSKTFTKINKLIIIYSSILSVLSLIIIFIILYIYQKLDENINICNSTTIINNNYTNQTQDDVIEYLKFYYNYAIVMYLFMIVLNCINVIINFREYKWSVYDKIIINMYLCIFKTIYLMFNIIISIIVLFNINCEYNYNLIQLTLIFPFIYTFLYSYMVIIKYDHLEKIYNNQLNIIKEANLEEQFKEKFEEK